MKKVQRQMIHVSKEQICDPRAKSPRGVECDNPNTIHFLPVETTLDVHPAVAGIFPLAHDDPIMLEDVRRNGQLDPGTVWSDANGNRFVVDGFRRYRACKSIGISWQFRYLTEETNASIPTWSVQRNIASAKCRQLNDSQRAIVGARLVRANLTHDAYLRSTKGVATNDSEQGRARDIAAKVVNVLPNRVRQALRLLDYPQIVEAVWLGQIAISVAARIAKLDPDCQDVALDAAVMGDRDSLKATLNGTVSNVSSDRTSRHFEFGFETQLQCLNGIEVWLIKLSQADTAFDIDFPSSRSMIHELKDHLAEAMPFGTCPACGGAEGGCGSCRGRGWATRTEIQGRDVASPKWSWTNEDASSSRLAITDQSVTEDLKRESME